MTNEELIAKARGHAQRYSSAGVDGIFSLDKLPKVTVVDAAVVYFESDEHSGKIEVFLSRESGEFITSICTPAQAGRRRS